MGVSGNLCSFLEEVKPLVLYDVEQGIAMEPMKAKWASSRVDLGYTTLFCIPEVTSVLFSSCDSVFVESLVFDQANRGSLHVWLVTWDCSAHSARKLSLISRCGVVTWVSLSCSRNLGYILELQRVWPFETALCSAKSGLLSSYDRHLRNLN